MGNETRSQKFEPLLDYYSQAEHKIHRTVPVYFTKALPMTFIMKLERESSQSRLYNLYQKVQDQQLSMLLILYGFKIERQESCGMCSNSDRTVEYWEYLNYTLEEHIYDRQQRGVHFTYHEMWHVVQVVLTAIDALGKVGLIWDVHPSMLEVTPEGKLKADWSHLEMGNEHLRLKKELYYGKVGTGPWWSPEERWAMQERVRQPNLSYDQINSYKLGLILLAMANLTIEPTVTPQTWVEMSKYEQPLPSLVKSCLNPDPRRRPGNSHLYHEYEECFNSSYQLMISEGKRQDLMELQNRAHQIKAEYRHSGDFSELRQGSRSSQFPRRFENRQTRLQTSHESYDQRLQALREYRKNLALSRLQQR